MTADPTVISKVDLEDLNSPAMRPLIDEWVAEKLFWSLDSCVATFTGHSNILSFGVHSSGVGESSWQAWYFAMCNDADCELLFIFTGKKFRGLGHGTRLLRDLIARSKTLPAIERIFLEVRSGNTVAIGLYEAHGFQLISRRKGYYADGEDALVYQFRIRS